MGRDQQATCDGFKNPERSESTHTARQAIEHEPHDGTSSTVAYSVKSMPHVNLCHLAGSKKKKK